MSRYHMFHQHKSKHLFRIVSVVILMLFTGSFVYAQSENALAQVESILDRLTEENRFSGAVLIAQRGEILLSRGYGFANLEWEVPNTPDTKFRIGSITKQFTAMAILIMHERGMLNVQDSICLYIDDCPDAWQSITIHHLLTHTSGISDTTDRLIQNRSSMTPRGMMATFRDLPLDFEPGTEWNYSNSGYLLLGMIIQEASGNGYQRFLQENIFEPLGMDDSGYDSNTRIIPRRAEGYVNSTQRAAYVDMSIPYSAGALYSTVEDLYRWVEALVNYEVVTQATWDMMISSAVPLPNEQTIRYGYGLIIDEATEHGWFGHEGGIFGFTSSLVHYTEENMTFIVLSNFESVNANAVLGQLARTIFNVE